jgi:hypothetical protein
MITSRKRPPETPIERRALEPSLQIISSVELRDLGKDKRRRFVEIVNRPEIPDGEFEVLTEPVVGDLRPGTPYLQTDRGFVELHRLPRGTFARLTGVAGGAQAKPPKAIDALADVAALAGRRDVASGTTYREGTPPVRGRAIVDAFRRKGYVLTQSRTGGLHVLAPGGVDTQGMSAVLAKPGMIGFLLALVAGAPLQCAAPSHEGPAAEAVTVGLAGDPLCPACVAIRGDTRPADVAFWRDRGSTADVGPVAQR